MLLEEDTYGNYAKIMLEYFLAEGIVSTHSLFVASQDIRPDQLISELPAVVTNPTNHQETQIIDEKMQIAWRYQNMKIIDSTNNQTLGHYYDLTKKMDKDTINTVKITKWDGENLKWDLSGFKNQAYVDLLKSIQEILKLDEFYVSANPKKRNILRIVIHSLGSRLWICDKDEDTQADLLKFFYYFRALMRSSYAVAAISVPSKNFQTNVRA